MIDFTIVSISATTIQNDRHLSAVFFFGSMYFQVAVGQEPTQASFSILTMFYSFFVAARIGGGWMDKFGAKKPVCIGLLLGTIGMIVWAGGLSELGHVETLAGMLLRAPASASSSRRSTPTRSTASRMRCAARARA
jgi:MFS family permease